MLVLLWVAVGQPLPDYVLLVLQLLQLHVEGPDHARLVPPVPHVDLVVAVVDALPLVPLLLVGFLQELFDLLPILQAYYFCFTIRLPQRGMRGRRCRRG